MKLMKIFLRDAFRPTAGFMRETEKFQTDPTLERLRAFTMNTSIRR